MKRLFLNVPAAAAESGVSDRSVRRAIQEGDLKVVQIGRRHFILRSELELWAQKRAGLDSAVSTTIKP